MAKSNNKPVKKNQAVTAARWQAYRWLKGVVIEGRSINELLASTSQPLEDPQQTAFAKQLLFGSVRQFHQIKAILDQLLSKAFKQKDQDLLLILVQGVYQLGFMSTADHAALSQSVELARKIKKNWACGLINGVLRQYLRQKNEIEAQLAEVNTYRYSHPNWIINQIQSDWPQQADQILTANNQQGPMFLRVNSLQISRDDYQKLLKEAAMASEPHPIAKDALRLEKACDVGQLPGFDQGLVTLQDAAPQLVVELMDLKPRLKVLDGCAAPGGKTTHILQRAKEVKLQSVEISNRRLEKIRQTLERMAMSCELIGADLLDLDSWWDGEPFDRILLDVPCTASGVIRRNPDIKIHRTKMDLKKTVTLQQSILKTTWQLLKPGGILVYATCSLFKQENQDQMAQFLQQEAAEEVYLPAEIATKMPSHSQIGYQILPGDLEMDGFYLCGLKKPQ